MAHEITSTRHVELHNDRGTAMNVMVTTWNSGEVGTWVTMGPVVISLGNISAAEAIALGNALIEAARIAEAALLPMLAARVEAESEAAQ
jgi:hypothetical protein